jgi:hypothetical protein
MCGNWVIKTTQNMSSSSVNILAIITEIGDESKLYVRQTNTTVITKVSIVNQFDDISISILIHNGISNMALIEQIGNKNTAKINYMTK